MMVHFDRIANEWLPISVALVLSTVLTMAVTAAAMLASRRVFGVRVQEDD
jgi:holin-like protein